MEKDWTFLEGLGVGFITSYLAYEFGIVELLKFYTLTLFTFYCNLYCIIGDNLRYFLGKISLELSFWSSFSS